jgi:hypothetical protein
LGKEPLHESRGGLYLIKEEGFAVRILLFNPPGEVKEYLRRINPYVLKLREVIALRLARWCGRASRTIWVEKQRSSGQRSQVR